MCRLHKSWYLKKVVGGRKRISSRAGNARTGSRCTRTHSRPGRRQNVKAGSGRQLLVPPLLSAWRLLWSWVASRGPTRLNPLKMSKHLRGVRAVPGPDDHQPSCPAHKPGWNLCVAFPVKSFGLQFVPRSFRLLLPHLRDF